MTQAHSAHTLSEGTVVGDTYRICRLIGKGGMGAVWEAEHIRLPGKRVAIKILKSEGVANSDTLARFRREAEVTSRLGHPNIVEIHDFNSLENGDPYLVLELLSGQSLADRIAAGPLDLATVQSIAKQIASALAAAHRTDIIHRDLKPQNIFLVTTTDSPDNFKVKVLDFGISKIRGSQTLQTQDSTILGTPQYMAPEQALGNHAQVDARTDIFSLGSMVFEMLAGKPAFIGQNVPEVVFKIVYEPAPSLQELRPNLPSSVCGAVHRALSKKPEQRFSDIEAFARALSEDGPPPHVIVPAGTDPSAGTADALAQTVDSNRRNRDSFAPTPPVGVLVTENSATEVIASKPVPWKAAAFAGALVVTAIAGTAWFMSRNADSANRENNATVTLGGAHSATALATASDAAAAANDAAPTGPEAATAPEPPETPPSTDSKDGATARQTSSPGPGQRGPVPTTSVPEAARNHLRAARKAFAQRQYREAIGHADRAIRNGAKNQAFLIRGQSYCVLKDQPNAIGDYHRLPKILKAKFRRFCSAQNVDI